MGAGKGGGGPSRGALVSGGPNRPNGRGRKGFGRSMSTSNLGGWTSGAGPSVAVGYQSESEKSDTSQSGTESEDSVEGRQRDGERLEDGGESEAGGGGAAACESRSKHKKKKGRERKKENAKKKIAAAFVERTVGTVPPQLKRCVRLWVGGFCPPSFLAVICLQSVGNCPFPPSHHCHLFQGRVWVCGGARACVALKVLGATRSQSEFKIEGLSLEDAADASPLPLAPPPGSPAPRDRSKGWVCCRLVAGGKLGRAESESVDWVCCRV